MVEVLRHMEKEYVNSIPIRLINRFYRYMKAYGEGSDFRMTTSIADCDELTDATLDILAQLTKTYWKSEKTDFQK